MNGASHLAVFQHAFRPVAERDDLQAFRADGNACGKVVHLTIGDAFRSNIAADPGIEDSRSVDAEQDAQTGEVVGVIDMRKGVHSAFLVVVDLSEDSIDDA